MYLSDPYSPTWNQQLCAFTVDHDTVQSRMIEINKAGHYVVHVNGYLPKNSITTSYGVLSE